MLIDLSVFDVEEILDFLGNNEEEIGERIQEALELIKSERQENWKGNIIFWIVCIYLYTYIMYIQSKKMNCFKILLY